MKYAYYPGCSASGTSRECEESLQAVMRHLGVELAPLEDWNCCGSTVATGVSYLLSLALPARNLALAEQVESDVVTSCSRCYMNLARAIEHVQHDPAVRENVNALLAETGVQYAGKARQRHVLDVILSDIGLDVVKEHVQQPLEGLRLAPYYGCQGLWTFTPSDSVENPRCLDQLLATLGAEVVEYPLKTACCGGSLCMPHPSLGAALIGDLLAAAGDADAIITICPFCMFNLNSFQREAGRARRTHFEIPVLFFTQAMGMAFGLPARALGLQRNTVSADSLYRKVTAGAGVSSGATVGSGTG